MKAASILSAPVDYRNDHIAAVEIHATRDRVVGIHAEQPLIEPARVRDPRSRDGNSEDVHAAELNLLVAGTRRGGAAPGDTRRVCPGRRRTPSSRLSLPAARAGPRRPPPAAGS